MIDKLYKNVNFNKSGTGGITPRLNLSKEWLEDMNVDEKNKEVLLEYNEKNKEITIRKSDK